MESILKKIRAKPCVACGKPGPSDPDHIKTRGSGGDDSEDNLWPLCRMHHVVRHAKGLGYMIEMFPSCKKWLEDHGRIDVFERIESRSKKNETKDL